MRTHEGRRSVHAPRTRIVLRAALACAVIASGLVTVPAAEATHPTDPCGRPYHDQDAFTAAGDGCHRSIVHPGTDQLMDRQDLVDAPVTYHAHGFDTNFLWYAPRRSITVGDDARWTWCLDITDAGESCAPDRVQSDHDDDPTTGGNNVASNFVGDQVTLDVVSWGGTWIALVCGNWLDIATPAPGPIPTITVSKFHDHDGDGRRDAGEPGIQGWEFTVDQVTSPYGGPRASARLVTDADGEAVFALDGYGPGQYQVEEVGRPGWEPTTPSVRSVQVDAGVGAREYAVAVGNRQLTDVAKTSMTFVDPPSEMEVGVPSELVVDVALDNHGPTSPVDVEDTLTLFMEPDCVADEPRRTQAATLATGTTTALRFVYSVTCSAPSFHDFTVVDDVAIRSPGVRDTDPGNDHLERTTVIPVIAEADLAIVEPVLHCDRDRPHDPYTCQATWTVVNHGPFAPVDATLALDFSASPECSVSGGATTVDVAGLAVDDPRQGAMQWVASCDPATHVRSFELDLHLVAVDQHVLDTDLSSNAASVVHTDADIKPNNDPNSINMKRQGVTAVAILSTDTLDAPAEVVVDTVRFGPTGTEAAALRCASEDANDDGLADLVCHFRVRDTGFRDGDTVGIVTAQLTSGATLFSTDAVRILHGGSEPFLASG